MPRSTTQQVVALPVGSVASMRPRRNAAEYDAYRLAAACVLRASMRPRRNAAEYNVAAFCKLGIEPLLQ